MLKPYCIEVNLIQDFGIQNFNKNATNMRIFFNNLYRNPLYWYACIKYLEIDAALNTLFGNFWILVLMPHLKPETLV